jgi:D-alanyl-D-alanine carboxypeptidase/D-alanyl-D-alanine-endopeptidase (penicillin-binding protein 4)
MTPRRCLLCVIAVPWIAVALLLAGPAGGQSAASRKQPPPASAKVRPDVARFRARVETALSEVHAGRAYWGILVADRTTGETLYELNADHFFTPASNAKIFTTALALATLGPDYRFRTTLESKGSLGTDGRLAGDLILVGRGDPDLSNRKFPYAGRVEHDGAVEKVFAEMADEAVAKGLREVDGDIVGDDSYYPYDPYPADWSVGDLFFRYGAPVSAIAFNDNTISVRVVPGERLGDPATVVTEPAIAIDAFSHEIVTGPAGGEPDLAVVRQPGQNFMLLRGTIPLDHTPFGLDLAMTAPAETAAAMLKQLLEARGVRVTGGTRARHAPPPETSATGEPILSLLRPTPSDSNPFVLAEHLSAPLLEIIRVTNKVSHNLHAELLLRAVGREKFGVGSVAAGLKVERDFLRSAGIADGDVVLLDGSGLSRGDLVTPRAAATLLRYVERQPWGQDFISTLPIGGVDGTLENRMRESDASGRIEAKTGEVEHVRALSGYAKTLRGEDLVFSIFFNNSPQNGAVTVVPIDAIATAMVETLGTAPPAVKKSK